jgi:hypothetical protein
MIFSMSVTLICDWVGLISKHKVEESEKLRSAGPPWGSSLVLKDRKRMTSVCVNLFRQLNGDNTPITRLDYIVHPRTIISIGLDQAV